MKIYFADLNYLDPSHFSHPLPLNVGFIAGYALKNYPELDIRIFKHPGELLDAVAESPPDILACSNYSWNSNLNNAVIKRCKQYHQMIVVMGGPDFPLEDKEFQETFFINHPGVDLYIVGEGEPSFLKLIQLLLDNEMNLNKININDWLSTFYSFDHDRRIILHNPSNPVQPTDLSVLPSPYLTGMMDSFLEDEHLLPIIETNRGCPYTCAYCVWGQATQSKIRPFDLQNIIDQLFYIGERAANPTKVLFVADANFGILKRDTDIAHAIMECKARFGFPQRLYIYAHKNPTETTLEAFKILSPIANMSMSLQTTNKETLKIIGRQNINVATYEKFRTECDKRKIRTGCEIIYGLPGETFDSFVNGLSWVLGTGQHVQLYTHLLIDGARTSTKAFRTEHGLETAFRIQTATGGGYNDVYALEYEEIVISTNHLSKEDYFRFRDLHFLTLLLGSQVFAEFRHDLKRHDYDIVKFAKVMLGDEANWPPRFKNILAGYRQACSDELLGAGELKREFTKDDIEKIKEKEINLAPACMCKLFARSDNIKEFSSYLKNIIMNHLKLKESSQEVKEELLQALNISLDRAVCFDDLQETKIVSYNYDIDAWLIDPNNLPLRNFKTVEPVTFRFNLHEGLTEAFEKAFASGSSLENSVYLLKYKFFPLSSDRIFFYLRQRMPAS
jgi:hypothetical protein